MSNPGTGAAEALKGFLEVPTAGNFAGIFQHGLLNTSPKYWPSEYGGDEYSCINTPIMKGLSLKMIFVEMF